MYYMRKKTDPPGPKKNPWTETTDSKIGTFDNPKLKSTQNDSDACSWWCQKTANDAVYYNYDSRSKTCYCITGSETRNPDIGPATQCATPVSGWYSGPNSFYGSGACPRKLTSLSSCHTASQFVGWPNDTLARAVTVTDKVQTAYQCADACDKASNGAALAAMFENATNECRCYKDWDPICACYDSNKTRFDDDAQIDLLTVDLNTQCASAGTHFHPCSTVGYCDATCSSCEAHSQDMCCFQKTDKCIPPAVPLISGGPIPCVKEDDCPCTCVVLPSSQPPCQQHP